jgi:hypothetical protein
LRPAAVFGLIANAVFAFEPVFAEEHLVMGST